MDGSSPRRGVLTQAPRFFTNFDDVPEGVFYNPSRRSSVASTDSCYFADGELDDDLSPPASLYCERRRSSVASADSDGGGLLTSRSPSPPAAMSAGCILTRPSPRRRSSVSTTSSFYSCDSDNSIPEAMSGGCLLREPRASGGSSVAASSDDDDDASLPDAMTGGCILPARSPSPPPYSPHPPTPGLSFSSGSDAGPFTPPPPAFSSQLDAVDAAIASLTAAAPVSILRPAHSRNIINPAAAGRRVQFRLPPGRRGSTPVPPRSRSQSPPPPYIGEQDGDGWVCCNCGADNSPHVFRCGGCGVHERRVGGCCAVVVRGEVEEGWGEGERDWWGEI